jgi:hypothetical protein
MKPEHSRACGLIVLAASLLLMPACSSDSGNDNTEPDKTDGGMRRDTEADITEMPDVQPDSGNQQPGRLEGYREGIPTSRARTVRVSVPR